MLPPKQEHQTHWVGTKYLNEEVQKTTHMLRLEPRQINCPLRLQWLSKPQQVLRLRTGLEKIEPKILHCPRCKSYRQPKNLMVEWMHSPKPNDGLDPNTNTHPYANRILGLPIEIEGQTLK